MASADREAKPGLWRDLGWKLARSVGLLGKRAASSPASAPTISGTCAPPPCAEVHPGRIRRTFALPPGRWPRFGPASFFRDFFRFERFREHYRERYREHPTSRVLSDKRLQPGSRVKEKG